MTRHASTRAEPRAAREHRAAALFVCAALAVAITPGAAHSWGARTHEIIHRSAVARLPEPARAAWAPWTEELVSRANDADRRKWMSGERWRHYIDIDEYGAPPFDDVPRSRAALDARVGAENAEQFGVVPWAVGECYDELVASLGRGDWPDAVRWAADLGHYVGDSHQPLHCTKHHDGDDEESDGVHRRFETTMMDRHFREAMLAETAALRPLDPDPVEACFDWVVEAHAGVATILAADRRARAADPDLGEEYRAVLWEGSGEVAVLQVGRAAEDLATLLQAAWQDAGSPPPAAAPTAATSPQGGTPAVSPGVPAFSVEEGGGSTGGEPGGSSSGRPGHGFAFAALGVALAAFLVASL